MAGCAIIDVTEGKGASGYGEQVEKGISGKDQRSVPAFGAEEQKDHIGRVLQGMRISSKACDPVAESGWAEEEKEAWASRQIWPTGNPSLGEHLVECGSTVFLASDRNYSCMAAVL